MWHLASFASFPSFGRSGTQKCGLCPNRYIKGPIPRVFYPSMAVYIVAASRTPIGSFNGALKPLGVTDLAAASVAATLKKVPQLQPSDVDELMFGCALQANTGQNPAKQVVLKAGLPSSVVSTTINKVCSSGLKAIIVAAQTIMTGTADVVVAGGAESMSNTPFYNTHVRSGHKYGDVALADGIVRDGLKDARDGFLMGVAAEHLAAKMSFSREDQDEYAIKSYEKALAATDSGKMATEIIPIDVNGTVVSVDQDLSKYNKQKLLGAKPAFQENGTVTAPNAPSLNDGAATLILVSERKVHQLGLTPIARICGWGEAERDPIEFTIAPSQAIPKALKHANVAKEEVDAFEINEAFSVVGMANSLLLELQSEKVNKFGGAVALGHPLGCSGARIIVTLLNVLFHENGRFGCAGICNGGGGASSLVVENLRQLRPKV